MKGQTMRLLTLRRSVSEGFLSIPIWLCLIIVILSVPAAAKEKPNKNGKTKEQSTAKDESLSTKKDKPSKKKEDAKDAKPETDSASKDESSSDAKTESASGKTHTVARGPFKHQLELEATIAGSTAKEVLIDPEESVQLQVREFVPHGTRVTKGQTVVKFDTTKLDEQIEDLESAKALAEVNLKAAHNEAEMVAKTAPLDAKLASESQKHADEDLARFEKIDRAFREKSSEQSVKQVNNFLEYVQEELNQLEKMYKADDLTEETEEIVLKRARNDVEQWKFIVEMVKYGHERDKEVEIPRSLTHYQHASAQAGLLAEKSRLTTPLSIEKEKLEVAKMLFEQKKAADHLARLKKDRERLIVTAPADGVLYYGRWHGSKWTGSSEVSQKLHVGAQLQPHDLVMTVVQTGPLEVQAVVKEKDLAHVTSGVAGNFCPAAWPDKRVAVKVSKLSAAPQTEGEFGATLSLDGASPENLVAGMTGKVKIVAYFKADAIAVPSKAVFHDDADEDKRYVLVVGKDGKSKRRDVTVGHSTDKSTEITSGLSVGEKILLEKLDGDKSSNDSDGS
jgi:HlyD family secretion protein